MKRKPKKYPRELRTPIEASYPIANRLIYAGAPTEKQDRVAAQIAVVDDWIEAHTIYKLQVLLSHYRIPSDVNCWRELALALAREHVAGFSVVDVGTTRKRGAPILWNDSRLLRLAALVEDLQSGAELNDTEACVKLATDPEHAADWGPPDTSKPTKWSKTLRSRLYEGRRLASGSHL